MTQKLLAVDDSKTMRKVLEITFGGEGFAATICGSSAEALADARAGAPQVALVDGGLAGSYDLIRDIKSVSPSTRVLVLSSKHRPYDESQGSAVGADGNFDKPFDSQKLIDKVNQLIGGAPAAAAPPRPVASAPTPSAAPRPAAPAPTPSPAAVAPRPAAPQPSVGPRPQAPPPSVSVPARPVVAVAPAPAAAPAPVAAAPRPVAAPAASASLNGMSDKLKELGLTAAQIEGVLSLSRTVVEQVVWEVVPVLAETLIKEEIARLTAD